MLLCENFFNFESTDNIKKCLATSWRNASWMGHRYFLDILLMHIAVAAAKFFTAGHRPHFFETCKPDKMLNCTLGTFVKDYECTNTGESSLNVRDASLSFFSGHASTCVYACLFICWYLQRRVQSQSLFLVPFMQTSLVCLAFFGSISRIFDHRHHWWDVLTGAIVGVVTTYHAVSNGNEPKFMMKFKFINFLPVLHPLQKSRHQAPHCNYAAE